MPCSHVFGLQSDSKLFFPERHELLCVINANAVIYFSLLIDTMDPLSIWKTFQIRGLTVKECEEKLSLLRKENFNLKLRIYFLEERMGHMNATDDKEDLAKKNIELRVKFSFQLKVCFYWSMQIV